MLEVNRAMVIKRENIRGIPMIQGTTEQQVMIGSVGVGGGNAVLTYFQAYGPMISGVIALTMLAVVVASFFLDTGRKNRKEMREKERSDREKRREERDILEHQKRMNNET